MEITPMQMYWVIMLDSIVYGSVSMCIVIITILFFLFLAAADAEDRGECPVTIKILIPILGVLLFALFFVSVFLPNTKQMAAIMIVPKIVNSEKVQTIGNRVYDIAVEWMNELKTPKK